MTTLEKMPVRRSLRHLLEGVVDYAGLFPPANLDMSEALANYSQYLQSEHAWMLGRFILPAARLDEFASCKRTLPSIQHESPSWRLSVLCGGDVQAEAERMNAFNREHGTSNCTIDAVELKISSSDEVRRAAKFLPHSIDRFFEISIRPPVDELLIAIREIGGCAKVRTGGTSPDMYPSSSDLGQFIIACAKNNVRWKATAGLHHPIRSSYRLTYEPNSQTGLMYGYLNVLLAAAFARAGRGASDIEKILEEQSSDAFQFHDDTIAWRDQLLTLDDASAMRRDGFVSFGSCSYREPVEGLQSLHLL